MTDETGQQVQKSIAPRVANPFGEMQRAESAGTSGLMARESVHLQTMISTAKRFPRDPVVCMDRILNACARPEFAEEATYEYSRGGTQITGPSIRLAEEIARSWGNMMAGFAQLPGAPGFSEVQAYAIDLESGSYDEKRFLAKHWRDTRSGGYELKDERDIYELIANLAQRRKRACILAVIPGDVVTRALEQCDLTLKTHIDLTPEMLKKTLDSFAKFGVTQQMIEKRIQRRWDAILPAQAVQLKRIYASLKDGMGKPGDFFEVEEQASAAESGGKKSTSDKLRGAIDQGKQPTTPPQQGE